MKQPKAPANLWEQLESLRHEVGAAGPPKDCFTICQYAERMQLSQPEACREVRRLASFGKLRRWGRFRRDTYFCLA